MYGPGRLLLASKKPKIQNLVKIIDTLTIEDIRNLPEKPDVIRGLIEIKELGREKGTNAELIASAMQKSHNPKKETPSKIYQYYGNQFWVKIKSTEILIQPQWYWLELSQYEVYISSNKIKLSSIDYLQLKQHSNYISDGVINDVRLLEKDRVSKLL